MSSRATKYATVTALLLALGSAQAELVTIEVTAQVSDVYDPTMVLGGAIGAGTVITGSYTYDTSTPDLAPGPDLGLYEVGPAGPVGFNLVANGLQFQNSEGYLSVQINNSVQDACTVLTNHLAPLANGFPVGHVRLDMISSDTSTFITDQLPAAAPEIWRFDSPTLSIGGWDPGTGRSFNINAHVTGLSGGNEVQSGLTGYRLGAKVVRVDDPGNALGGSVRLNSLATGTLFLRTDVEDYDPSPERGDYPQPIQPGLGFDLALGGIAMRSHPVAPGLVVHVKNENPVDHIELHSYNNAPVANGAQVQRISLDMNDGEGTALLSDRLSGAILLNPQFEHRRLAIQGESPQGPWYVELEVFTIEPASASAVMLSPASGTFDRFQKFELGVLFAPGVMPEMPAGISLHVNGEPLGLTICNPGAPNMQQRATLVCYGVSDMLQPGHNQVTVDAVIGGQTISDSVTYHVIE